MTMTTVLIVNIALDVAVSVGVLALAAWAIRTGESDPGPPDHGPEAEGGHRLSPARRRRLFVGSASPLGVVTSGDEKRIASERQCRPDAERDRGFLDEVVWRIGATAV
jgi:hypothetical protein